MLGGAEDRLDAVADNRFRRVGRYRTNRVFPER